MAYVKIPKDFGRVKTKVALNLTKRQLIGFSIAGLFGFPTYLLCKNFLSTDISMILMSLVVLPILFVTLYEKDNQPFEKHLAYILRFHKSKKIRVYQAKSIYNTGKKKGEIKMRIKRKTPISKAGLSGKRRKKIE